MPAEMLFKTLTADGTPAYGGSGRWSLPTAEGPGDWMPRIEPPLELCEHGYHLCRRDDLIYWLNETICTAECRGEWIDGDDKIAVAEARLLKRLDAWNERTARLFVCDCAEDELPIWAAYAPNDDCIANCIRTGRLYADGQASAEELAAAAAAGWRASWSVPRPSASAWAAALAGWAASEEAWSVSASAWSASRSALRSAMPTGRQAGPAAGAELRAKQTARLMRVLGLEPA